MKRKIAAKKSTKGSERRGKSRRTTTDRRRDKGRWDPKIEDRRKGFGRRKEDKAWDRLASKFE